MFLKQKSSGDLVELVSVDTIYDPSQDEVVGKIHAGEEMQDPETFSKSDLIFPSGESLPLCWLESQS
jgi:hypothetical protein